MSTKKKIGLVLLALLLALVIKLIWFEPPFTQEAALDTARWQLRKASGEMMFDLSKFGEPDSVGGNNKDGYLATWNFQSKNDNSKLFVIVSVTPLDIDFTGSPFLLDCRPGRDHETRQAGFGYLCKAP